MRTRRLIAFFNIKKIKICHFYITHILILRSFSKTIRSNYPKVIYNTPKNIKINYKVVVGHEDKSKELYILGKT